MILIEFQYRMNSLELIDMSSINKVSVVHGLSFCSNTELIRYDSNWDSEKNSLELILIHSVQIQESLVNSFSPVVILNHEQGMILTGSLGPDDEFGNEKADWLPTLK